MDHHVHAVVIHVPTSFHGHSESWRVVSAQNSDQETTFQTEPLSNRIIELA